MVLCEVKLMDHVKTKIHYKNVQSKEIDERMLGSQKWSIKK